MSQITPKQILELLREFASEDSEKKVPDERKALLKEDFVSRRSSAAIGFSNLRTGDRRIKPKPKKLPKSKRPICGAKTRAGRPCQARAVPGKERCRLHGGLSTGPRSEIGRDRIAEAQRHRWAKWRAEQSEED